MGELYCERCKKVMKDTSFYRSNDLIKYPMGFLNKCKSCSTLLVDNWDSQTFLPLLEECDVPWVPEEWTALMLKYATDASKVTGQTIIGRYLSKMKLRQYKDYRWKDTDFLREVAESQKREKMRQQGYDAAEITAAINNDPAKQMPPRPVEAVEYDNYFDSLDSITNTNDDISTDLSEEDKKYLRLKWGKIYKPEEWVKLEQLYEEMTASYDIQLAGHRDNLKKLCKTSLKVDQLLDIGDVDGAQKMMKMYDALMKMGKFTAIQNKEEQGEYVNCIGEMVAICERDGFIPRYYTEEPQDRVDRVIQDMQEYTRSLVTEEMNLGNLIERAVKQIEIDKNNRLKGEEEEELDEEQLLEQELYAEEDENYTDDDEVNDLITLLEQEEQMAREDAKMLEEAIK